MFICDRGHTAVASVTASAAIPRLRLWLRRNCTRGQHAAATAPL